MTDERGVYEKFRVERTDSSPRHPDCRYFVLDIDHDPHAAAALVAYAEHCQRDKPDLARDLRLLTGSSIVATTPGLAADLIRAGQPQGEPKCENVHVVRAGSRVCVYCGEVV